MTDKEELHTHCERINPYFGHPVDRCLQHDSRLSYAWSPPPTNEREHSQADADPRDWNWKQSWWKNQMSSLSRNFYRLKMSLAFRQVIGTSRASVIHRGWSFLASKPHPSSQHFQPMKLHLLASLFHSKKPYSTALTLQLKKPCPLVPPFHGKRRQFAQHLH